MTQQTEPTQPIRWIEQVELAPERYERQCTLVVSTKTPYATGGGPARPEDLAKAGYVPAATLAARDALVGVERKRVGALESDLLAAQASLGKATSVVEAAQEFCELDEEDRGGRQGAKIALHNAVDAYDADAKVERRTKFEALAERVGAIPACRHCGRAMMIGACCDAALVDASKVRASVPLAPSEAAAVGEEPTRDGLCPDFTEDEYGAVHLARELRRVLGKPPATTHQNIYYAAASRELDRLRTAKDRDAAVARVAELDVELATSERHHRATTADLERRIEQIQATGKALGNMVFGDRLEALAKEVMTRATSAESALAAAEERSKVLGQQLLSLEKQHVENCAIVQHYIQAHGIGLGGENIFRLIVRHAESLAAQLAGSAGGDGEELAARRWLDGWEDHKVRRISRPGSAYIIATEYLTEGDRSTNATSHVALAEKLGMAGKASP